MANVEERLFAVIKSGQAFARVEGGIHLKQSSSWLTWASVALLLIFAGIASAVVPLILDDLQSSDDGATRQERGSTSTTIDVSQLPFIGEVLVELDFIQDNIQGKTITLLQAFGISFGVVLMGVGAMGLAITIGAVVYARLVDKVYADESYQAAEATLTSKEKAALKELAQNQPPSTPDDPQRRARNSAIIFGFLIVMMAAITALTIGVSLLDGGTFDVFGLELSAGGFALVVSLITAVILILVVRRRGPMDIEQPESENQPINWGVIWVVVTGLIVVGVGAGIAIAFSTPG
jgi:hypothetical protein